MNTSAAIAEREDNTHYGSFLRAKIMLTALDLASAVTTHLRSAGSPLEPSPYCTSTPQVLRAPRADLTTRLRDFATNRHE
jgi:hypothetical protein